MAAERYVAVPTRVLGPALEAGAVSQDKIVLTDGSVPESELTEALATGSLPADWTVSNYGHVTHGLGIPFMMMGLALLAMCIVVYVIVSLLTAAPTREELDRMGWRPPLKVLTERKITGPFDPRVMAFGLIVLMVVLYILMR
jgi:hypothetical protein